MKTKYVNLLLLLARSYGTKIYNTRFVHAEVNDEQVRKTVIETVVILMHECKKSMILEDYSYQIE